MVKSKERCTGISKVSMRTASSALTLAVALFIGIATTQMAHAQGFNVLYNFTGAADGGWPYTFLIRDTAGNLYGTTEAGGTGFGTVFKLSTTGKESVLYSFTGGSDGANPFVGLVRDAAGNLYGATAFGGTTGLGTVFKLSKSGKQSVLHTFTGGADGCYPFGGLIRDAAGNLYGTTEDCGASGVGTVFKVSKSGKETILHSFAGPPSDGEFPSFTSLLMDAMGNFYGVTEQGGAGGCSGGCGAVYKLSKSGKEKLIYSFTGETDGCDVFGTPAMDSKGNLYGTTNSCGDSHVGTAWKVSQKGSVTVLHTFTGGSSDGAEPIAGLVMDANGNLYGDTYQGGSANLGTVYKLNKKGAITLLHTFTGPDGDYPYSGLIRDGAGTVYGTTLYGGSGSGCRNNCGTVWEITK